MRKCQKCNDANEYGDYEGPTCDVCHGYGHVIVCDDGGNCYLPECMEHGCMRNAFSPLRAGETVGEWTTRVQGWPPSSSS